MFADMRSMMMKAWYEHYALLATDCMNLESAHAAIRMAERNRASIILNLYQGRLVHLPAPAAAVVVRTLAESASVPVALASDHGKNPDCTRQASRAGFSGLTIDASAFPLGENVCQTRAVMELAVSAQLCAEGEPGHLTDAPHYDRVISVSLMIQSTDVEPFITQINIDLLAVLIGIAHGTYAPDVVSAIDFQHLTEISRRSSMSLALHDGSGIPFDQLQLRTTSEVVKINVGAAISKRGKSALLHTLCHDISIELTDTLKAMELAFEEAITPYLQMSGPIGKA